MFLPKNEFRRCVVIAAPTGLPPAPLPCAEPAAEEALVGVDEDAGAWCGGGAARWCEMPLSFFRGVVLELLEGPAPREEDGAGDDDAAAEEEEAAVQSAGVEDARDEDAESCARRARFKADLVVTAIVLLIGKTGKKERESSLNAWILSSLPGYLRPFFLFESALVRQKKRDVCGWSPI